MKLIESRAKIVAKQLLMLLISLSSSWAGAEEKIKDTKSTVQAKLDCQPGEVRHFNYESLTRVWGSANQHVQLRASLRLTCMESPLNSTLKYMTEVLSLEPVFQSGGDPSDKPASPKRSLLVSPPMAEPTTVGVSSSKKMQATKWSNEPHAEPVFEEISEAIQLTANRMKRSLGGWFSQTWSTVKDFFVNIFNSGERSSVSRDQAFTESGIDISSQCRAKKKKPGGLPIDDSVFDDLEPKYYVGASSDPLVGTAYIFDNNDDADDADEDADLSFFDEPRVRSRSKRAISGQSSSKMGSKATAKDPAGEESSPDKQLKLPFIFFQSRMGKIIEVRFSPAESDLLVKNFKRHLCDLFATNLDKSKSELNEMSPIGQHTTKYLLDSSKDSAQIKQSLLKSASSDANKELAHKQLVRVLALSEKHNSRPTNMSYDDDDDDFDDADGGLVLAREPDAGRPDDSLSVLRSINSTSAIKLNSRQISPEIERVQLQVEQVQQISGGRMVQAAGQLGASLIQQQQPRQLAAGSRRSKRSAGRADDDAAAAEAVDIAELLQVSSSYSVQLVPLSRLGNFSGGGGALAEPELATFVTLASAGSSAGRTSGSARPKRAAEENSKNSSLASPSQLQGNATDNKRRRRRGQKQEPLVIKPASGEELEKSLRELRQAESKLQLTRSSSLLPESPVESAESPTASSGRRASEAAAQEALRTRLRLIRDQIQMRLNEEFMRNRLRERTLDAIRAQAILEPALASSSALPASMKLEAASSAKRQPNSLGLGLTQLVLDSGVTSRRKGSVYSTIEEALELESQLDEDAADGSVSRLMRETIRLDKLRQHCKSSIASLAEIRSQSSRLQMKPALGAASRDELAAFEREKFARIVERVESKNKRRLEQCKLVVGLMLRTGDKKVAETIVELIDECDSRLLAASKDEELGFGPASRYYRNLRQQFIELLASMSRPSDLLLDRLMSRLQMAQQSRSPSSSSSSSSAEPSAARRDRKPTSSGSRTTKEAADKADNQPEFTYVRARSTSDNGKSPSLVLLKDEDYAINNNDVLGSLVMTLTSLASRPTIRREKRAQLADKLLAGLLRTSCSVTEGPDLDILEAMGNFREPLDEIASKVVHLARKCRPHSDQYVIACVHALRGQMEHPASLRLLGELVKTTNVSCSIKSEIVLTLLDAVLIEDLAPLPATRAKSGSKNDENIHEDESSSSQSKTSDEQSVGKWPAFGLNKLDDILIEQVDAKSGKSSAQDRRCLAALVGHYLSKKQLQWDENEEGTRTSNDTTGKPSNRRQRDRGGRESRRVGLGMRRFKRAIVNDDKFWDEAQCKRWVLPGSSTDSNQTQDQDSGSIYSMATDLVDEIDEASLAAAIATSKKNRSARRNQQLLERETDSTGATWRQAEQDEKAPGNGTSDSSSAPIRRRHKCTASKKYGPKNAEATLRAEIVNDLIGARDENKFLARFKLSTSILGNKIDVGRMYLWHQKQTTRAHVNILGKSLWDSSQGCAQKAPHNLLYMPLFDFNLWLVKISVGLKLQSEMGFFSNCPQQQQQQQFREGSWSSQAMADATTTPAAANDQLELYPTISLRASGEASARFVVARAGMSVASQYGYQGNIRVSRQPNSCMSIASAHQPMNVTFSSWFQLWDGDCHYWGSRERAEPHATRWRLAARRPTLWLRDECLQEPRSNETTSSASSPLSRRSAQSPSTISP